ncbi:MAG: hypothetical protein QXQ47_02445 [Candidatus Bathyarchaeia archaeon]
MKAEPALIFPFFEAFSFLLDDGIAGQPKNNETREPGLWQRGNIYE